MADYSGAKVAYDAQERQDRAAAQDKKLIEDIEPGSIAAQVQRNYSIINGLEDLFSRVQEAISPVLKQEDPIQKGDEPAAAPQSPLAEDLAQQHYRLQRLAQRMADTLVRVNL